MTPTQAEIADLREQVNNACDDITRLRAENEALKRQMDDERYAGFHIDEARGKQISQAASDLAAERAAHAVTREENEQLRQELGGGDIYRHERDDLAYQRDEAKADLAAVREALRQAEADNERLRERFVYAVVNSSYADEEVHGLYATRDLAYKTAERLRGMWTVSQWVVNRCLDDAAPPAPVAALKTALAPPAVPPPLAPGEPFMLKQGNHVTVGDYRPLSPDFLPTGASPPAVPEKCEPWCGQETPVDLSHHHSTDECLTDYRSSPWHCYCSHACRDIGTGRAPTGGGR